MIIVDPKDVFAFKITIQNNSNIRQAVANWLKLNVEKTNYLVDIPEIGKLTFHFKNQNDAMLFKLIWL